MVEVGLEPQKLPIYVEYFGSFALAVGIFRHFREFYATCWSFSPTETTDQNLELQPPKGGKSNSKWSQ